MGFAREYQGWAVFEEKFKPIKNHISKHAELMFETYGEEFEFVKSQDPHNVWTWVEGDMSSLLVPGIAYVNRLGYYITEVPWEDDMDTVLLSVEVECECYDEERIFERGEAGSPECEKCEGYGLVTEYVNS